MTPEQIGQTIGIFGAGVLGGLIPQLMALRRKASSDSASRAQNEAQESKSHATKDYFDNMMEDRKEIITDRENWKKTANEAWGLLRIAESQIARLTALQEHHEKQLLDRDKQIDKLWKLVIRFAPATLKEVLEVEFAKTQPGSLDGLPLPKGKL